MRILFVAQRTARWMGEKWFRRVMVAAALGVVLGMLALSGLISPFDATFG
jgi:hypothetical protein